MTATAHVNHHFPIIANSKTEGAEGQHQTYASQSSYFARGSKSKDLSPKKSSKTSNLRQDQTYELRSLSNRENYNKNVVVAHTSTPQEANSNEHPHSTRKHPHTPLSAKKQPRRTYSGKGSGRKGASLAPVTSSGLPRIDLGSEDEAETVSSSSPTKSRQSRRKMGPIKENSIKRKATEDLHLSDIKRLKSSNSDSPEPRPIAQRAHQIAFPLKPAEIEERNGDIEFRVVNNDGQRESHIIMTGLKNIFQKQLPKMPKDYIARLVYDRTHLSMAIVKKPLEVVGGITYRPFKGRTFAEIVFCAISSDQQVKGYGAHLMSHLKDYVKASSDVMHFLTYADNYAIGYFKKQGFTKEITLDKKLWMGYIKDYEGGTIMQCSMLPRIRYLEMGLMLQKQKEAVQAKIRAFSRSHEVHQPPKEWANGAHKIDPMSIAAIKASGWSQDMDELARQPRHGPNYSQLLHLLNDMQNHQSAWPFLHPVNRDDVADYYDVIKEPMDLSTMEAKLDADNYHIPEDFVKDAKLVFDNCRKYNNETTPYAKLANKLEKYMWQQIKAIPEWSHLEA